VKRQFWILTLGVHPRIMVENQYLRNLANQVYHLEEHLENQINLADPQNVLTEQPENLLTDLVKVLADQVDIPTEQLKPHINLQGNPIPYQYQESQEDQLSFPADQV